MLMVDYVIHLDEQSIETTFDIAKDTLFVDHGMLSEVGVIENAAQTCSGIVAWPHFESNKTAENYQIQGFISKIDRVDLFRLPKIGETLITKGKLLSMHAIGESLNCKMTCLSYCSEDKIAQCNFTLILQP
jgi:hypothetical protein